VKPIRGPRNIDSPPYYVGPSRLLQKVNDLGGPNPHGHRIHRRILNDAIRINHKHCRLGDPAVLPRIEDVPVTHNLPFRIAQNRERQRKLFAQGFGNFRWIHRHSHQARTRRLESEVVVAIIRQLAKAERSPTAAIEEQDQSPARNKNGKTLRGPRRIGEFELSSNFAANRKSGHQRHSTAMANWPDIRETDGKAAPAGRPSPFIPFLIVILTHHNLAECACEIVLRSRREEKLIGRAVFS
jgi:hypothetical protein